MKKYKMTLLIIFLLSLSLFPVEAACPSVTVTISAPVHALIGTINFSYTLTNTLTSQQNVRVTEIIGGTPRSPSDHTLAGSEAKTLFSQAVLPTTGTYVIDIMLNEDPVCITSHTVYVHNFIIDTWATRQFYYPSNGDEIIMLMAVTNLGSAADLDLNVELRNPDGDLMTVLPYSTGTDVFGYDTAPVKLTGFIGTIKFGARYQTNTSDEIGTWKFKATLTLRTTTLQTQPKEKEDPLIDEQGYLHIPLYQPEFEMFIADIHGDQSTTFNFQKGERNDFKIIATNLSKRQVSIDFEVYIFDGGVQKWKYVPSDTYPSLCCNLFDIAGEVKSKQEILVMIPPNAADTLQIEKAYTLKVIGKIQGTTVSTEATARIQYLQSIPELIRRVEIMKEGQWIQLGQTVKVKQTEESIIRVLFINTSARTWITIDCVHIRIIDPRSINVPLQSPATYSNIKIPPNTSANNYEEITIRFTPTQGQEGQGEYTLLIDDCKGVLLGAEYPFNVEEIPEDHIVSIAQQIAYVTPIEENTNLEITYALKNEGTFDELIDVTYYMSGTQISVLPTINLRVGELKDFKFEFPTHNLPTATKLYFRVRAYMRSTTIDLFQDQEFDFTILPKQGTQFRATASLSKTTVLVNESGTVLVEVINEETKRRTFNVELTGASVNVGLAVTSIPGKIIDAGDKDVFEFQYLPSAPSPPEGYMTHVYVNGVYVQSVSIVVIQQQEISPEEIEQGGISIFTILIIIGGFIGGLALIFGIVKPRLSGRKSERTAFEENQARKFEEM